MSFVSKVSLVLALVAGSAQAQEVKEKIMLGTQGERVTVGYKTVLQGAGNRPNILAKITSLRLDNSDRFVARGSKIAAVFVLSSTEVGANAVVLVACESSDQGTVCQNVSEDLPALYVGSYSTSVRADINLTVVYKGKPVVDSYDRKPYFVMSGF